MNRIFEDQEMIVLSDKELVENNGYVLVFSDGSSFDVTTRTVTNKGPGTIIIRDLPMWPPMSEILKEQKTFASIKHLNISGDMNNIIILPNEGTECLVSVGGAIDFVQNSSICQRGDELFIETPESKSNVHISMGSVWVNGKRLHLDLKMILGILRLGVIFYIAFTLIALVLAKSILKYQLRSSKQKLKAQHQLMQFGWKMQNLISRAAAA